LHLFGRWSSPCPCRIAASRRRTRFSAHARVPSLWGEATLSDTLSLATRKHVVKPRVRPPAPYRPQPLESAMWPSWSQRHIASHRWLSFVSTRVIIPSGHEDPPRSCYAARLGPTVPHRSNYYVAPLRRAIFSSPAAPAQSERPDLSRIRALHMPVHLARSIIRTRSVCPPIPHHPAQYPARTNPICRSPTYPQPMFSPAPRHWAWCLSAVRRCLWSLTSRTATTRRSHIFSVRCAMAYCMTRVVLWPIIVSRAVEKKTYFFSRDSALQPLISQLRAPNHGSDRPGRVTPLAGSVFLP